MSFLNVNGGWKQSSDQKSTLGSHTFNWSERKGNGEGNQGISYLPCIVGWPTITIPFSLEEVTLMGSSSWPPHLGQDWLRGQILILQGTEISDCRAMRPLCIGGLWQGHWEGHWQSEWSTLHQAALELTWLKPDKGDSFMNHTQVRNGNKWKQFK